MAFTMDINKILQYMTNTFSSISVFIWLILGTCAFALLAGVLVNIGKKVGGGSS